MLSPFVVYGLFLLCYGVNPVDLYVSMVKSTFGDLYGLGEVLLKATPFVLTGLAAALPAKAGLVNVGGEGQLAIGALFATWFGVFYLGEFPAWLGIPLMMIAGALGGAVWAGLVAVLKVKGRLNETITSVLLNYVATFTVGFFVHGLLKDPESFNWPFSPEISSSLRLPIVDGTRLHIGFVVALALAAIVWFVLSKTRLGFRIRVLGSNRLAAQRAGFNINKMYFWVLIAAGMLAGIAGMIEIAGIEGRLRASTGVNFGYLGFLAAMMAWNNPLRLIVTAFLLGMISVAGNTLEIGSGLPSSSVNILMALVLFFILGSGRWAKR
ncbi:ABC transporter permease [Cohnella faecalis]|uniref:ABC transporter permease n=2 Tax=Cohnella faecalis TaxID=2315694 RepID=A0A398CET9_9BACL|nr:ABC transporter permease [Cohnella faecalis]